MANPVPQFTKDDLTSVQSMASHIIAAAARYGVPPEAIAGSLAVEQFDQKASLWKRSKAILSALDADGFLGLVHAGGYATDSVNYERGASDIISDLYSASPNAITVGQDSVKKLFNPLLVDYGPAGVKFHNAIQAILNNPDDPAFAPYVNNLYSAGRALQDGSDPKLTAAAMAAYLQQGIRVYQANMSINGDPQTGINAWNNLSPSLRNALLVQFYKQGPTPERVLKSMSDAAQRGVPYVPQIGADGAGATYAANESTIAQALMGRPRTFRAGGTLLGHPSQRRLALLRAIPQRRLAPRRIVQRRLRRRQAPMRHSEFSAASRCGFLEHRSSTRKGHQRRWTI